MAEVSIRPELPPDYVAIRDLVVAAFDSEAEGDLVDNIRVSDNYIRELSLVAELAGAVVGHTMVSRVELMDGATRRVAHSLAPVAVTDP